MRITGGRARGIAIKAPPGGGVRPATDYLREAVFSSLGPSATDSASVLDLFAGTGAYGWEALSRGAASVTFVEEDRAAIRCWESNRDAVLKALGRTEGATLRRGDCFRVLAKLAAAEQQDLIFVDPPYELWNERGAAILELAVSACGPGGAIVAEAPGGYDPVLPDGWGVRRRLAKGARQPSALIIEREQ